MKIVVGSLSGYKLEAVLLACQQLGLEIEIQGIHVSSGQSEEPVGFNETYSGALTRAQKVLSQSPDSVAIGIESGIFRFGADDAVTMDIAFIVVLTPEGRRVVTTSTGIRLPEEHVTAAAVGAYQVSHVIAQKMGGHAGDPHSVVTDGKVSRTQTLKDGIVAALAQLS